MGMDEQAAASFYVKEFKSLKEKTNKFITQLQYEKANGADDYLSPEAYSPHHKNY